MTLKWIAQRLPMGSWIYVSNLLGQEQRAKLVNSEWLGDTGLGSALTKALRFRKRPLRTFLRGVSLAFSFFSVCCQAQTVYSTGPYSMGKTLEHDWTIGTQARRFGLVQYCQSQDAFGQNLYAFTDVRTKQASQKRFTVVHCGFFQFRVESPAWFVAVAAMTLLVALLVAIIRKTAHVRKE
jgi:hypothetical protein